MSRSEPRILTPKYVLKDVGKIFLYKNKYVFVSDDGYVMMVSSKLKDLLSRIYERVITVFFDRDGNLHVRYEKPVDGDYMYSEDVWEKQW